jgi:hypothetical protein
MDRPASGASAVREDAETRVSQARRQALVRLGLGAAIAYVAPAVIRLDRAYAHTYPSHCHGRHCGGGGHGGGDDGGHDD